MTRNFSIMAGFSIFPFVSFNNQLKYIASKIGFQPSEKFAVSVGALYISTDFAGARGLTFVVATFGQLDKSFTAGIKFGYTKEKGGEFKFGKHPIIMFGGNIRLSNSIALISENWLDLGEGFDLNEQPFSIAIRFLGRRIAVDIGAILIISEILEKRFPIPWLSFTYNFGK